MSKMSQLFLSLVVVSAFAFGQNTGTNQPSDPGAAGPPAANQTDPSANGQTTQAKKKHKHKKNKDNMSSDPSMSNPNNGTSTSQGTGTTPQDPGAAPNTPTDQTPQANPPQDPPQTTPPQR